MILAVIAMIVWLRHLLGCLVSTFRSRQDLILENLALAWAGWRRPLTLGDTQRRGRLASCRVSAVLEVAFASPIEGRGEGLSVSRFAP